MATFVTFNAIAIIVTCYLHVFCQVIDNIISFFGGGSLGSCYIITVSFFLTLYI